MSSLFKKPKVPPPPPTPPPTPTPVVDDNDVRKAIKKRYGRAETHVVKDFGDLSTTKGQKSLLGGQA